jgi:glutamate 5-kinase
VNENDTVAVDEIDSAGTFGDNDTLSAVVAMLTKADVLIMLTDIDGLYTADPHCDSQAEFIPQVDTIDDSLRNLASGAGSARGTGGMVTKLNAAEMVTAAGIPAVIMNGTDPKRLYKLFDGEPVGTLFSSH